MMADTKKTADKVKDTINERIVDPAKKAGEAIRAAGSSMAEDGSAMGMKMLDQAEENARQAFAAMRAAAQAKDVAGVMKVQGDYLREQGARSMSQAREIGELIMQFGKNAIAPLSGKK